MITALLIGTVIGLVLSIPPGPLALAFMKKAVSRQYSDAMLVATGAAVMDVFYNLLAAFASSAIVLTLSDVFLQNRWLSIVFQLLCIIVLAVLGVRHVRDKHNPTAERHYVERERAQEERAKRIGHGSPFFLGTLIAFTNLATPTFLPSMIAVLSYLHAEKVFPHSVSSNFSYSIGFGIGTTIWFFLVLRFVMKHQEKLTPGFITAVYRIAGVAFIIFALLLAYNVMSSYVLSTPPLA
ncbi:MAG: LysE family transporter [Ignavibacteriae bacterium]|nr:LysE family transporter [Ignavibacteriota bacterium]